MNNLLKSQSKSITLKNPLHYFQNRSESDETLYKPVSTMTSRPSSDSAPYGSKDKYDALSNEAEITLLDEQVKYRRKPSIWRRVIPTLFVVYVVASLAGMSALSWKLEKVMNDHDNLTNVTIVKTGKELGDCGSSIAEARANKCHFDPMSWLWVPHSCYKPHEELVQEWKTVTDWHFYTDVNMQEKDRVSTESAFNGDYDKLFTPYKYHKIHCSYSWQKQHAILSQRLPIDDNTLSKRHMKHCQKVLLNEFFHQDVNCTETADNVCPIQLIPEFVQCGYF